MKQGSMNTDKKILGIPPITFIAIVVSFCALTYYASGYASENAILVKKFTTAKNKIRTLSRFVDKLDRKVKICSSNVKANEDSNRDLTMKLQKSEQKSEAAESKNSECSNQLSDLHQFYLKIRDHAGLLREEDKTSTEPVTTAELQEVSEALNKKQEKHEYDVQQEKANCDELLKSKENTYVQRETGKEEKLRALLLENNQLKEEIVNVRKLQEEAENKYAELERERSKRGFLQRQQQQQETNIRMIDLNNQKKEQPNSHTNTETKAPVSSMHTPASANVVPANETPAPVNKVPVNITPSTVSTVSVTQVKIAPTSQTAAPANLVPSSVAPVKTTSITDTPVNHRETVEVKKTTTEAKEEEEEEEEDFDEEGHIKDPHQNEVKSTTPLPTEKPHVDTINNEENKVEDNTKQHANEKNDVEEKEKHSFDEEKEVDEKKQEGEPTTGKDQTTNEEEEEEEEDQDFGDHIEGNNDSPNN